MNAPAPDPAGPVMDDRHVRNVHRRIVATMMAEGDPAQRFALIDLALWDLVADARRGYVPAAGLGDPVAVVETISDGPTIVARVYSPESWRYLDVPMPLYTAAQVQAAKHRPDAT